MNREPHLIASPSPVYASRRDFLRRTGSGFGMLALAGLLESAGLTPTAAAERAGTAARPLNPLAPHAGSYPTRAKRVIWLFMNGGPSQVDTWDYKPDLARHSGQELKGFDKDTGFFTDSVGP